MTLDGVIDHAVFDLEQSPSPDRWEQPSPVSTIAARTPTSLADENQKTPTSCADESEPEVALEAMG